MKVGLILPGNIWFCPYVSIYTHLLEKVGVDYDIISWNRDGSEHGGIQFNERLNNNNGRLSKLLPFIKYASFIKKTVKKNNYDRLIVFGPQVAIFINRFLSKYYKERYIFDYRDLSIEQKRCFKRSFLRVLRNSFANVISSPGFKRCLPEGFEYLLSHNFSIEAVRKALRVNNPVTLYKNDMIKVLTIGGIRNYSSNIEIVKALANKENFTLQFVGKGSAADMIKEYAKQNKVENIDFEGFYPKEKEPQYIRQASFLNIFYPRRLSHDTILSNRFYNALIYRKPMIVTTDTIQGDYVERYQLGLSLDNCDKLDVKMKEYLELLDYETFSKRCDKLLNTFLRDYEILENKMLEFVRA